MRDRNVRSRLRRLLLLLPAAMERKGEGLPIEDAVALTGAKDAKQVRDDVQQVEALWRDPSGGEDMVSVYVENDVVQVDCGHWFGTPTAFSLAEGAVLLAALKDHEKEGPHVRRLADRLRRAVPEPLRPDCERLARGLDVVSEGGPWTGALQEAIDQRREVTLEYRAVADHEPSKRVVEPRLLFCRDGHWYLAAWNVAKGEEHLFRLDRVVAAEVGTRVFGAHKGPPVQRYARRHLFFESGAEREVAIRYRGDAARLARTRHAGSVRENADGTVTVTAKVTPGNYLFGQILAAGGDAALEGPPDVVDALRGRVDELRRLYAG